jgi:uncharacterized hydrophobic protein (TIGR00271 family)
MANSAAVVIGAMLVAPLMSAILGLALGTVTSQSRLSLRSIVSLLSGVLAVVSTAFVAGSLANAPSYGVEITSRTQPTLLDLLVAVAAGLAGAYSLVCANASTVLPGVAIATALVPPLSVVGLELAVQDWPAVGQAFLLFTSNFLAIYLAAALVFTLAGFGPRQWEVPLPLLRQYGAPLIAFSLVGVVLTGSLRSTFAVEHRRVLLRQILSAQSRMVTGAQFVEMKVEEGEPLAVQATVRTPASFNATRVAAMEKALNEKLGRPVRLVVRSIIAKDADARGYLEAPTELDAVPGERGGSGERRAEVAVESALKLAGAEPLELEARAEDGGFTVGVRYQARVPLEQTQIRRLEQALVAEMGVPVWLDVRHEPQAPDSTVPAINAPGR